MSWKFGEISIILLQTVFALENAILSLSAANMCPKPNLLRDSQFKLIPFPC